jgi:hypothetical protein
MPGPFTHIYTARRVADYLAEEGNFVRTIDGPLDPSQAILPAAKAAEFAEIMKNNPKFTNLGAIGPDLFFFLMDFHQDIFPGDEVMLALRTLYFLDDAEREDWEPLLAILEKYNHTWAAILRFLIKLDKIWNEFKEVWDNTIGEVTNAIGEVVDDLTGGMLTALGDAMTQFGNALVALFVQEVLSSVDIFSFFSLVMQEGVDEQAFLWSDMLHYRKTSTMAANLLKQAEALNDPDDPEKRAQAEQFMAYALGYICHMGTDIIAHSFVNEQCGGPFRTHWQRHHLIENHMDAFTYSETKPGGTLKQDQQCAATPAFPSLAQSALYFTVQLTPDEPEGDDRPAFLPPEGKTPAEKTAREEALDTDGEMPDWLARGIVKAMIDTYQSDDSHEVPANLLGSDFQRNVVDASMNPIWNDEPLDFEVPPGFPLPWEVQTSYRFMLSFFKRTYMDGFDLPKPPRPTIAPAPTFDLSDLPPDFSGVHSSDPPAKQLFDIIKALLSWAFKHLKHGAEWAYDEAKHIASTATYPAREAIYENITLPAWQVVRGVREVLVHMSYLTPQDEEFRETGELMHPSEIDLQLIQLGHSVDGAFKQALADAIDPLGNLDKDTTLIPNSVRDPQSVNYPFVPINDEYKRPWAFPNLKNDDTPNEVELGRVVAGPYPVHALPDILLETQLPASNFERLSYEMATLPLHTDRLNDNLIVQGGFSSSGSKRISPLGGPISFTAYLMGRIAGDENYDADFNLDSDRGYGYLCWGWNRDQQGTPQQGYRGRNFRPPCIWPEAAKNRTFDPQNVLALHYKKEPDPGCGKP